LHPGAPLRGAGKDLKFMDFEMLLIFENFKIKCPSP
jgi:hypothetical protein